MKPVFLSILFLTLLVAPWTFADSESTQAEAVETTELQETTEALDEATTEGDAIDITASVCPTADDSDAALSFLSTGVIYECVDPSVVFWCSFLNCPSGTQCAVRHFVTSSGCCNSFELACVAECETDVGCGFVCP